MTNSLQQADDVFCRSDVLFIDTTRVILGWFAGLTWKNKWYT